MFDLDGSGRLDYREFQQVIRSQGGQPPTNLSGDITLPDGILANWFGKDGSKSFGFDQFVQFLKNFQLSIIRSQISAHTRYIYDVYVSFMVICGHF